MRKLIKAITSFDYGYLVKTVLFYTYMSFIYSLMVSGGVGMFFDQPVWVFGLTLFFSIFHLGDFPYMTKWQIAGRFAWLVVMASGVSGAVWMMGTRRPVQAEWWGGTTAIIIVVMVTGGFIGGLIEGLKPRSIRPYLARFTDWWLAPANGPLPSEPVLTRLKEQKQAQQIDQDNDNRVNLDKQKPPLDTSDVANESQHREE